MIAVRVNPPGSKAPASNPGAPTFRVTFWFVVYEWLTTVGDGSSWTLTVSEPLMTLLAV